MRWGSSSNQTVTQAFVKRGSHEYCTGDRAPLGQVAQMLGVLDGARFDRRGRLVGLLKG